jgi:hypothetical protein
MFLNVMPVLLSEVSENKVWDDLSEQAERKRIKKSAHGVRHIILLQQPK